jgi:kynurenine formamidase
MRIELAWIGVICCAVAMAAGPAIDPSRVIDLSYRFDEKTIYWPTAPGFRWTKDSWGISPGGYWYASASFAASEHGGTHLDSPIHFAEKGAAADEIPLDRLIAPAVVIDMAAACVKDRDYQLRGEDVAAWERAHGRIGERTIELVRTGWGRFWPDKKQYLGSDVPGDTANLHFPGVSRAAADLLVKRKVAGVGIDTASLDHGPSKDFMTHRVLNGAGVYGLENVANLEKVPPAGATLIALPMKIRGGTGGPVRIIAVLP